MILAVILGSHSSQVERVADEIVAAAD